MHPTTCTCFREGETIGGNAVKLEAQQCGLKGCNPKVVFTGRVRLRVVCDKHDNKAYCLWMRSLPSQMFSANMALREGGYNEARTSQTATWAHGHCLPVYIKGCSMTGWTRRARSTPPPPLCDIKGRKRVYVTCRASSPLPCPHMTTRYADVI